MSPDEEVTAACFVEVKSRVFDLALVIGSSGTATEGKKASPQIGSQGECAAVKHDSG